MEYGTGCTPKATGGEPCSNCPAVRQGSCLEVLFILPALTPSPWPSKPDKWAGVASGQGMLHPHVGEGVRAAPHPSPTCWIGPGLRCSGLKSRILNRLRSLQLQCLSWCLFCVALLRQHDCEDPRNPTGRIQRRGNMWVILQKNDQ